MIRVASPIRARACRQRSKCCSSRHSVRQKKLSQFRGSASFRSASPASRLRAVNPPSSRFCERPWLQQPFIEAAEGPRLVDEMDFKDPVTLIAIVIGVAHAFGIGRCDAMEIGIAVDTLDVRELADDVAGDLAAEQPSG